MDIVVLLKTHLWNGQIENSIMKIMAETLPYGIDFYILMHTDDGKIYDEIKSDLIKNITLKISETDIKNIYSSVFYNMWVSNHWVLMWFYKNYGSKYKYYWSIEYDVGIVGDSSVIWRYNGDYDFLYTKGNYNSPTNKYFNYYVGNKILDKDKRQGFLQIARYSNRFLNYLDKCFKNGENGQDELIIFSLANIGNFSKSNIFLSSLIRGTWAWEEKYSARNKIWFDRLQLSIKNMTKPIVYILHPLK